MADPSSKSAALQRVYALTVPVHDLMGDGPTETGRITVTLARADGRADLPLFGPQGLIDGDAATQTVTAVQRDPSSLSESTYTFNLLPNEYYFVPTVYLLQAGDRAYRFTMPAEASNLVELLDGEPAAGGGDGSGEAAAVLPTVASVEDAAELAAAEGGTGRPIFALVSADFGTYLAGDVLVWTGAWSLLVRSSALTPRTLGKMMAWMQAAGAVDATSASDADIQGLRPGMHFTATATAVAQVLYVGFPDALRSRLRAILIDGRRWSTDPLTEVSSVEVIDGQRTRLWSVGGVDVSGGAQMWVELELAPA